MSRAGTIVGTGKFMVEQKPESCPVIRDNMKRCSKRYSRDIPAGISSTWKRLSLGRTFIFRGSRSVD